MSRSNRPLNSRQRHFAKEYLVDRNATQAAIRAGYSPRTARVQGPQLLLHPAIKRLINSTLEQVEERTEIKLERVLTELHRILTADIGLGLNSAGGVKPLQDWPEDLRRALSGIDVEEIWGNEDGQRQQVGVVKKVKFWSKTHSAEQLLRHLGAFNDRVEVTTKSHAELMLEIERRAKGPTSGDGGGQE